MASAYSMSYPSDPWSSLQHNPHVASKASIDYLSLDPKKYIRNNPLPSLSPGSAPADAQIPAAPHVHRPKNVRTDRYEDAEASTKEGNIVNLMAVKTIQHYSHKDDSGPGAYVYQGPVKVSVASSKRKRRLASAEADEASWSDNDHSDDHRDTRRRSSPRPKIEEHIDKWGDARRKTSNSAFRATTRRDVSDRERHRSPPTPITTSHTKSPIMIIEENPLPPIYSPPPSYHHHPHHQTLVFRTHTANTFYHRPLSSTFHALADPAAPPSPPIPTGHSSGSMYSHNPTPGPSVAHELPSTSTNPQYPSISTFHSFQASHPHPASITSAPTSNNSSPRQGSASPRNLSLSPSPDAPSPRSHSRKPAKPSASSVNGAAAGSQQTLFTVFSQLPTKTDRNRKATSLADISKRFWVYKCTRCRRMKQKCDVGSPKCWRCERAGVDCMYPEERPPGWSVGKVRGHGTSEEEENEEDDEDGEGDEEGEGSRAESEGSARDGYVYRRNRSTGEVTSGEEGGQVGSNYRFVTRSASPVAHVDAGIFTYQHKTAAPSKQDKEKAKERRSEENVTATPFDGLREEERSSRGREGERVFRFTAWRGTSPIRRGGKGKRKREDGGHEEGRFGERLMKLESEGIGREPEVNTVVVVPRPERWDDSERQSRNHDSWVDVKVEARAGENSTISDNLRSEKRRRDRQMVLRRPWEEGFESLEEEEDNDDEPQTGPDEYHSHIHPRAHPTEPPYNSWCHDPQSYHDEPPVLLPSINDSHSGVRRVLHTPTDVAAPYRAMERLAEQMVSDTTPYTPSSLPLTSPAYLPRPVTPPSATHRLSFDDNLWTLASSAVTRNLPSPTPSSSPPPRTPVFPPEHACLPAPTATKPSGPITLPSPSTLLSSATFMPVIIGNVSERRRVENIMELSVQQMQPKESDMRNSVGTGSYRTKG
ncbi:hypothetical protein BC937DRAFT_89420 [Endogone sp. FLAS-F59071]|nr:hypothetical protein BC937DRAFT_89420 [Endogone sp. FLAS-F59071]|eukprot:RUS17847.1 hypothetical protein BC937DRAFT_89420 [Endogone sp. FLAS-F59071]